MYYNAIFCRIIGSVNVSGDVNKLLSFKRKINQVGSEFFVFHFIRQRGGPDGFIYIKFFG